MSPWTVGAIVFGCVFGGAMGGMLIRGFLPEHHVSKESQDVVKLGMGLIATLAALVLSLLIASVRSSFDTKETEIRQFAADLILLHRTLAVYGPETAEADDLLRRYTTYKIAAMWPDEAVESVEKTDGWRLLEGVQSKLRALAPQDDGQRWLQARALTISGDISRTRWVMREQRGSSISTPFLVTLVFWLSILFVSFGVFAPRNATVVIALFVCSLSIAGAVFLILEMDEPFSGLMQISSAPMHDALGHLSE